LYALTVRAAENLNMTLRRPHIGMSVLLGRNNFGVGGARLARRVARSRAKESESS
jgi:hypothetical protein